MSTLTYINLHKMLVAPLVIAMMWFYGNTSTEAFVYLAMHGTYTVLWMMKETMYPDRRFQQQVPPAWAGWLLIFLPLGGYYVAPWLLISRHVQLQPWAIGGLVAVFVLGVFLHYVSDAQKFFTLRQKPGLITDGLFSRTRNPNYLGEILIYASFGGMSVHWLPFVVLGGWCVFFVRNMLLKDRSLARHPGYEEYRRRTGLLLPKLWLGQGTTPFDPL